MFPNLILLIVYRIAVLLAAPLPRQSHQLLVAAADQLVCAQRKKPTGVDRVLVSIVMGRTKWPEQVQSQQQG